LSHKNAIKHKKGQKSGTPRFFDNSKYPPKKIRPKPQGPPWISNYSASMNVRNSRPGLM